MNARQEPSTMRESSMPLWEQMRLLAVSTTSRASFPVEAWAS